MLSVIVRNELVRVVSQIRKKPQGQPSSRNPKSDKMGGLGSAVRLAPYATTPRHAPGTNYISFLPAYEIQ